MKQSNWSEVSSHVLAELKRLDKQSEKIGEEIEKLNESIHKQFLRLHVDIATLKAKSTIWGAIAGTLVSSAVSFYFSKGH